MNRSGQVFIAILWGIGAIAGVVIARTPEMVPLPVPHFMVPLIAGLILDLASRPAIQAGRIEPVGMNERAIGVLGAAMIAFGIGALAQR